MSEIETKKKILCQHCSTREAIGPFWMQDGLRGMLCEVCSEGMEPITQEAWLNRNQRKIMIFLVTVLILYVLALVWLVILHQPLELGDL